MKGILDSLWRVGRKLTAPKHTRQYPEEPTVLPARYRARIVLTRDPDGQERCVACNLCSVACPVDCIEVEKGETEAGACIRKPSASTSRAASSAATARRACPTQAIQLTPDFETADYTRAGLIHERRIC